MVTTTSKVVGLRPLELSAPLRLLFLFAPTLLDQDEHIIFRIRLEACTACIAWLRYRTVHAREKLRVAPAVGPASV